jgi:TPR repeat protein
MCNLSRRYGDGLGVTMDYQQARPWFKKAAAAGNATAMFKLG